MYKSRPLLKFSTTTVLPPFSNLTFQGNGEIDEKEFVGILKSRCFFGGDMGAKMKGVNAPVAMFQEKLKIWQDKLSRIYGIYKE